MKKTLIAALAMVALAAPAIADETNPSIVHRQGIYKIVSGHMNGLKSALFLKGATENVTYHAEGILVAFQHMGPAWPEGSGKGETKAKANIWTERAKFDEAGKKAYGASLALVDAAKAGDNAKTAEAFKALGAACKACHEDFKKD